MFPWLRFPSPDALQVALTFFSLLAIWFAWAKVVGPRVWRMWQWASDLVAVFKGRGERVDRVTGEKRKAVPSLVDHLVQIRDKQDEQGASIEKQGKSIENLTTVLTQVADQQAILTDQQVTLGEHTKQIADLRLLVAINSEQIGLLKAATVERAEMHKESAAMLDLIAKRDSDVIDPQEEP
jgi:hypothetical protein